MKRLIVFVALFFVLIGASWQVAAVDWDDLKKLKANNACKSCDFSGANLIESNLTGANLFGANLSGANLNGVDFTSANLKDAKLVDVSMSRVKMSNTIGQDGKLIDNTSNSQSATVATTPSWWQFWRK